MTYKVSTTFLDPEEEEEIVFYPDDGLCEPEEELIAAVIASGFREKDIEYINGRNFEFHCNLLGLDARNIRGLHEKYTKAN